MQTHEENNTVPDQRAAPPSAPPFPRKLQFHRVQLIGVPLLMVLPILGLLGVFGESLTTVRADNAQIAVQIDYATRYRYKMNSDMRVTVTNLSAQSPVTVTVVFDRSYIDPFSAVTFMPAAARITEQGYEVELPEMYTGESQFVAVELRGEEYWQHRGVISAGIAGGEAVQQTVATTIFP